MRALFVSACCWAVVGAAQEFSPPPLVQADAVDPSQGRVIPAPRITNQPLDPNAEAQAVPQPLPSSVGGTLQPQPPPQPQANLAAPGTPPGTVQRAQSSGLPSARLMRIGMATLIGGGIATAGAIVGGFVGGEYLRPGLTSIGNVWTGGAIGFALTAPIGVLIAGLVFQGDAPWYAPILGDLVGTGVSIIALAFGGPSMLAAPFTLPLAGSIIGYEISSSDDASQATVAPVVSVLPGGQGGLVGVQGRF